MSSIANCKIKELRGLIYSNFNSESEFARVLGWSRQRLNKITNGIKEPNVTELNALAIPLNKSVGEMAKFFLESKSPNG